MEDKVIEQIRQVLMLDLTQEEMTYTDNIADAILSKFHVIPKGDNVQVFNDVNAVKIFCNSLPLISTCKIQKVIVVSKGGGQWLDSI